MVGRTESPAVRPLKTQQASLFVQSRVPDSIAIKTDQTSRRHIGRQYARPFSVKRPRRTRSGVHKIPQETSRTSSGNFKRPEKFQNKPIERGDQMALPSYMHETIHNLELAKLAQKNGLLASLADNFSKALEIFSFDPATRVNRVKSFIDFVFGKKAGKPPVQKADALAVRNQKYTLANK